MGTGWGLVITHAVSPAIACVLSADVLALTTALSGTGALHIYYDISYVL